MLLDPRSAITNQDFKQYSEMSPREYEQQQRQNQEQYIQGSPALSISCPRSPSLPALPLLLLDGADTLVFIDPPPLAVDGTRTIPHRVHSERLLISSSTFFQKLFQPRYQTRVCGKRGFADKLPDGIKYVVDLTPPDSDEDAIIYLMELSCPMGIRTWAMQKELWNLPPACIGGTDEVVFPEGNGDDSPNGTTEIPNSKQKGIGQQMKQVGMPVEYSPHRHREGIEHILHVLEGLNPKINTACKIWTFFGLAKIFDVLTVPAVSDHILSWFYESTNARIIQIHPEIAYRVACGLKAPGLCRDAFVELVGDEALLYMDQSANRNPKRREDQTIPRSQIRDFLDDAEVQRIEYASKTFADRVVGHFLNLVGAEMSWLGELGEFQKLLRHLKQWPTDREALKLISTLKGYVRSRLYSELRDVPDMARARHARPKEPDNTEEKRFPDSVAHHRDPQMIHQKEDVLQRTLGRSFWRGLSCLTLVGDSADQSIVFPGSLMDHNGLSTFRDDGKLVIPRVTMAEIWVRIEDFNAVVQRRATQSVIPSDQTPYPNNTTSLANPMWNLVTDIHRPMPDPHPRQVGMKQGQSSGYNALESLGYPGPTLTHTGEMTLVAGLQQRPSTAGSSCVTVENYQTSRSDVSPFFPFEFEGSDHSRYLGPSIDNISDHLSSKQQVIHPNTFEVWFFFKEVIHYLRQYSLHMLHSPEASSMTYGIMNSLSVLTENECRFLPLWAGGNDDGTGGVFTDQDIPVMEIGGFSTPGPAVHTGSLASTEDSFSDINPSDSQCTIQQASNKATTSYASEVISINTIDLAGERGAHTPVVDQSQDNTSVLSGWSIEDVDTPTL